MTTLQEACVKALDALEKLTQAAELHGDNYPPDGNRWYQLGDIGADALRELRTALAQQELPQKERTDFMAGYDAGMSDAKRMAQQGEPSRPDIIEKLSYRRHERDDMTLDDCLTYLQTGGWHKVHGRTERHMVLQLTELLAAAPAPRGA